jgi:geranylgeranyl pyrophosphate synthase
MEMFGLYLGYAYQIIDDILDFQGSNDKLGKPVFSDLLQGNVTLPAILLLEHYGYSEYIDNVIRNKSITDEIKSVIMTGLSETGALNKAYAIAEEFCAKAQQFLNQIPDSSCRQYLQTLPETLLARCN